jgi:sterol desaturase/sphingolipid hydroxylase (fatty acid hydroxylase superfamily)
MSTHLILPLEDTRINAVTGSLVYLPVVAGFVLLLIFLEWISPWRPQQKQWREALGSDALFAVTNGLLLGPLLVFFWNYVIAVLLYGSTQREAKLAFATDWPLWLQCVVAVIGMDLIQWSIHNALHKVPWLWTLHKVHHSIVNGEMDWLASLRFHWAEEVLYISVQSIVLSLLGFSSWALLLHGLLVLIFGFFNHANFELGWGPLRYLLNTSKMHIWHHNAEAQHAQNFGVIFSSWDWLFGTAYMPEGSPRQLGFPGVETFPKSFLRRNLWPFRT